MTEPINKVRYLIIGNHAQPNIRFKGTITADTLRNKMPPQSAIIDYIPLKQLSDSFSDLIVTFDKKNNAPQFVSVYNAKEQIAQIAEQYSSVYLLIDSDTILLNQGVDYDTSKYIAGYEKSIDYIVNNEKRTHDIQRDSEASLLRTPRASGHPEAPR